MIPHKYNDFSIDQTETELIINGVTIPKAYVNLGQIAKAHKKRLPDYFKTKNRLAYFIALAKAETTSLSDTANATSVNHEGFSDSKSFGLASGLLIQTFDASGGKGNLYGHLEIAIDLSVWISPEANVWANKVFRLVLQDDLKALTAEAEEAQAKLKELWGEIRAAGKQTRRTLTDAIKDWYENNPGGTSCSLGVMIAKVTNSVYEALWGFDALQIEEMLGSDRHKLRDHLPTNCLKELDRAEANVIDWIDLDNMKPTEAVKEARLRKTRHRLN